MRHEWILDVLRDLKAYALANGLPAVAAKADEALQMARAELSPLQAPFDPGPDGGPARRH